MRIDCTGQHAVVTGASRGLGRAWALALATAGAHLWLVADHEEELQAVADRIRSRGGDARVALTDLGQERECARLVAAVLDVTDHVDVLVNNAAVLRRASIERLDPASWAETIAVNLTAPFLLMRGLLPAMLDRGGSIVNVSSRAGVTGFAGEAAYCASKFGIEGLTRAAAADLAGTRVSVNTLTPGLRIKPTGLTQAEAGSMTAAGRAAWRDPDTLAPAFLQLAMLRGEVSGLRFDAETLARAIRDHGRPLEPDHLRQLAT